MKKLTDMSLEELWQLFPIVLKEYNPKYPDWYNEEKARAEFLGRYLPNLEQKG